jgi:hypothetical protein
MPPSVLLSIFLVESQGMIALAKLSALLESQHALGEMPQDAQFARGPRMPENEIS